MSSLVLPGCFVVAASLPVALLILRRLDVRRDLLFLAYYFQAFLYVQVGPWLYMRRTPEAAGLLSEYETLAIASLVLFNVVILGTYLLLRGREPVADPRSLDVVPRKFGFANAAFLAFAAAFWVIALTQTLVFRRIGNTIIPKQLQLSLRDFVVYRSYIEGIWLIASVVFAGLVVGRRRTSPFVWIAAMANLVSAYLYLVINSRISLALVLTLLVGLWALLWRGSGRYLPRLAFAVGCAALLLLYSTSTTERIRVGFGKSGTVGWRAFLPGLSMEEKRAAAPLPGRPRKPPPEGVEQGESTEPSSVGELVSGTLLYRSAVETPLALRLNGIDMMARMESEIARSGYAWGRAWIAPIELIYLPIVAPEEARRMKLRFDIAAKSYLLRHYTDIDTPDYFSCMLTDAYGNFGYAGMAMVGLFLGAVLALSTRALRHPRNGLWAVVALFALSHIFQFEQEFVTAAVLWAKKIPVLVAVLILNPFATAPGRTPNAGA